MYPEEIVKPMKLELTDSGFSDLTTSDDVKSILSKQGTTLIVVNSVCGCAARNARPGVIMSLSNNIKPDNLCTVFAGFDIEATILQGKKCYLFHHLLHLLHYSKMVNWFIGLKDIILK